MKSKLLSGIGSIALLVAFLAAWQWLPGLMKIPSYILPNLHETVAAGHRLWVSGGLLMNTGVTALEIVVGFLLGSLLGVLIGVGLGLSSVAEAVLSPYILALQISPKVAFAPLFVIWMGFTIYPRILVAVLIVFFPVLINVLTAVKNTDPDMINLVRTLNGSRLTVFRLVEFPAALPALFSGLRIGSTLAVVGVTVGELVGGNQGLGVMLVQGEGQGDTAAVFVTIVMLTLIGILAYGAVVLVENRVLHYIPRASQVRA